MWNPLALAGFVMLALAWPAAVLIYAMRPRHAQNRALAVFLFMNGIWGVTFYGLRPLLAGEEARAVVFALGPVGFAASALVLLAYLAFIATVPSPLTRPLRRPWPWLVIVPAFLAWAASAVFAGNLWITGLLAWRHSPGWQYEVGPMVLTVSPTLAIAISLFGIAVAVTALRQAQSRLVRNQLKWYAAAFITYDVLFIAWQVLLRASIATYSAGAFWERFYFVFAVLPTVLAVALLSYGILKTQLFGIDLKVKWTLRRGTVVGALAIIFFVIKEAVEALLPGEGIAGGLVGAIVVAGLAYPAWLGASRLTDRLMHSVEDSPAYRQARGLEIYQAAFEELVGGGITAREQRVLEALRTKLGIASHDAQAIEKGVAQSMGVEA